MRLYPKEMKIMKIVIFGAAGATGRIVVERALAQGHEVTAFDLHTAPLTIQHPKLTLIQGDIFNLSQVEAAIAGQDVVISVLGVRPGVTIPVCSEGTKNIIEAMQKRGVKRFICQSGFVVAALDGEWREVPYLPIILPFFPKMIAAGVISGLLAAIVGTIDAFAIPSGTRAKSVSIIHGVGNSLILVLFAVSWFLRLSVPGNPPVIAYVLSFLGATLLGITGWLGGELTLRLGIGVDEGANLNAPSSLSGLPASQI
jgi:hypothetical protein